MPEEVFDGSGSDTNLYFWYVEEEQVLNLFITI